MSVSTGAAPVALAIWTAAELLTACLQRLWSSPSAISRTLVRPQTVDLLRVAFEGPGAGAWLFIWYPSLAEARKTDAFEQLVTDMGFVKGWRENGDWGDYCRPAAGAGIVCS